MAAIVQTIVQYVTIQPVLYCMVMVVGLWRIDHGESLWGVEEACYFRTQANQTAGAGERCSNLGLSPSCPQLPRTRTSTQTISHHNYTVTTFERSMLFRAQEQVNRESYPHHPIPFHPAHPLTHSPTHSLATLQKLKVQRDKLKKYQKQVSRPNFYAPPEPPITQLHAQLHLLTHALAGSPDRSIWYYKRRRKSRRNSIERRRRSKLDSPAPHVFQLRIALPCWLDLGHSAAVLYRRRMFHLQCPLPSLYVQGGKGCAQKAEVPGESTGFDRGTDHKHRTVGATHLPVRPIMPI
jgi:hypothetical protein